MSLLLSVFWKDASDLTQTKPRVALVFERSYSSSASCFLETRQRRAHGSGTVSSGSGLEAHRVHLSGSVGGASQGKSPENLRDKRHGSERGESRVAVVERLLKMISASRSRQQRTERRRRKGRSATECVGEAVECVGSSALPEERQECRYHWLLRCRRRFFLLPLCWSSWTDAFRLSS